MGKSSLINFILRRKAVGTSANPNTTKGLQTHLHRSERHGDFVMCDCPGTTAPRLGIPKPLEVLLGLYPVSQCPDPYSVLRHLAEHCAPPLHEVSTRAEPCRPSS